MKHCPRAVSNARPSTLQPTALASELAAPPSNIRTHMKLAVSLVIAHGHLFFLRGLCGHDVGFNILTLSPTKVVSQWIYLHYAQLTDSESTFHSSRVDRSTPDSHMTKSCCDKAIIICLEFRYPCSSDFTSLCSGCTADCNYWCNLGSMHQVPVTAEWTEAVGNMKFAWHFAWHFYTWLTLGIKLQTFWFWVQCPSHLATCDLSTPPHKLCICKM